MSKVRPGLAIIVSSPSGGGKTTLCQRLLQGDPNIRYSVTCTTRAPRSEEQHGTHYFFLSKTEFERRIAAGDFLEYAQYNGHYYGTPRSFVEEQIVAGRDVLMAIEVQGAAHVMQLMRGGGFAHPNSLVTIFLRPTTLQLLEQRLRKRGQDDEAAIQKRLHIAQQEMAHWREYDYTIITGTMEEDADHARAILIAERCRTTRVPENGEPWQ